MKQLIGFCFLFIGSLAFAKSFQDIQNLVRSSGGVITAKQATINDLPAKCTLSDDGQMLKLRFENFVKIYDQYGVYLKTERQFAGEWIYKTDDNYSLIADTGTNYILQTDASKPDNPAIPGHTVSEFNYSSSSMHSIDSRDFLSDVSKTPYMSLHCLF